MNFSRIIFSFGESEKSGAHLCVVGESLSPAMSQFHWRTTERQMKSSKRWHESHGIVSGVCVCEEVIHAAVFGANAGTMQALRRKRDRTHCGFMLLVFHVLNWAVDFCVQCREFSF